MRNRPLVQLAATAVAAAFLLVAALGFVPGITTSYSEPSFAGHEPGAELLGLFQVGVLHLFLGVAMVGSGVVLGKRAARTATTWRNAPSASAAEPVPPLDATRHRKEVRHVQGVRMRDRHQRRVAARP